MNRCTRGHAAAVLLGCVLGWVALPGAAGATPLLSEVFYDASGPDDGLTFVELSGAPGTVLDGLVLEGINGSNGAVTDTVALSGVVGPRGLFLVADDAGGGASGVAGADLVADFDFQNGPDSVVLRDADGVLDALGYGDFGAGDVFAGEGAPAPDAPSGSSLARVFADVDTDDNAADFVVLDAPTPGTADFAPIPEPSTALLLAGGLVGLARAGGRRTGGAGRGGAPAP